MRFLLLAVVAALLAAQSPNAWRVEKSPANPILTPDSEPVFPNSDFEAGDWSHWRVVSGAAWVIRGAGCPEAPNSDVAFGVPSRSGGYRTVCSEAAGRGVLASEPFALRRRFLRFLLAGVEGAPGVNRVELVDAASEVALLTAYAPQRATWGITTWDVSALQGRRVYLRLVDGSAAWLGVGHFYASDSAWEDFAIRTPGLLHDEAGRAVRAADGRYWLFYSGETYDNTKRTTLQRMGLAFSPDLSKWTRLGHPIIPFGPPGAFDERQTADPDVVLSGGVLWMFYAGNNRRGPIHLPEPDRGKVGLAWCAANADCTRPANWIRYRNAATADALLAPPVGDNYWGMSVLRHGGRWMMWVDHYYQGTGEQIDLFYGEGERPDTARWKAHPRNPVWSIPEGCGAGHREGEIGQPSVFRHGGRFYMVYHRNCGTGRIDTALASSADGVRWTAFGENLALNNEAGKWDAAQIHMPFATLVDGKCYVFYSGAAVYTNDLNRWSIGVARIANFR
jgi:hypothetical protein